MNVYYKGDTPYVVQLIYLLGYVLDKENKPHSEE